MITNIQGMASTVRGTAVSLVPVEEVAEVAVLGIVKPQGLVLKMRLSSNPAF